MNLLNSKTTDQELEKRFSEVLEQSLLSCVYQPVADFQRNRIHGWEAFVRGPENSYFHQPGTLLSYASQAGKLCLLDKEMRQTAIHYVGQLSRDQLLFMKTHMKALNDPDFVPGLTLQMIREYGLKPDNIVLQFEEDLGIRDYDLLLKNLDHYRDQGFKVSIDKFGRSTLQFLAQIRPNYIKLDPLMIRGISFKPLRKAVVEGMIKLCEKIGTRVIAAGIETHSEYKTLCAIGLRYGQGRILARPQYPKSTMLESLPLKSTDMRDTSASGETAIKDLIHPAIEVTAGTKVSQVKQILKDKPPLCSVVICRNKMPCGLIMSYHLDRQLGTQYGVSLFYRRDISVLMDSEPLIVEADQRLGDIAGAAMNREPDKIYDDIIVTADGEMLGTVSVQDMLSRLAKIEIMARERAESATLAKSRFLANMSHDIRTPMNAILGMADLLWESPLTADQKKFVSVFRNAGENLLELINEILDLSKVEAGQVELETIEFDLSDLMEKTCEAIALKVHEKKIELICHVDPKIPSRLIGDPTRLRQVLSNLIGNAVKFTRKGEIAVAVEMPASLDAGNTDSSVNLNFSIRDTGIGIPKDKHENIFDTFMQAHSSTSREYGGTGLGLAICRRLVELMNGKIRVESEPGTGSDFQFTAMFPVPQNVDEVPVGCFSLDNVSILVIDDNHANGRFLEKLLVHHGADIEVCSSGESGLEIIARCREKAKHLDIILIDANMPGMSGIETIRRMMERFDLGSQIIMMIDTVDLGNDQFSAKRLGIARTLVKPVKQDELFDAVGTVLGVFEAKTTSTGTVQEYVSMADVPPMNILLAEDNENNRILFSFYMKDTPHRVKIVENGKICLETAQNEDFDIVFMDIDMPVMDGYKATDAIRRWERETRRSPLPIIALTAHALKGKKQESLDAGCTDHISKPFKKQQILDIICKYADGGRDRLSKIRKEMTDKETETENHPEQCDRYVVKVDSELEPLIPKFITITRREIDRLKEAIRHGDYKMIKRLGHRIKGACLCYCFEDMGDIALKIEQAGSFELSLDTVSRLTDDLSEYIDKARVIYSQHVT